MLAELAVLDKRPGPANNESLWIWIVTPPSGVSSAEKVGRVPAAWWNDAAGERTIVVTPPGRQRAVARSARLWLVVAAALLVGAGVAVAEVDSRVSAWRNTAIAGATRVAAPAAPPEGDRAADSFALGAAQSCLPCVCPRAAASQQRAKRRGSARSGWRGRRLRAAVERHLQRARRAIKAGRWQPARLHAAKAVRLAPRNRRARRLLRLALRRGRS